ncbi:hypothetical protein BH23ACT5_BH23ACT5_20800 [soil metagenome]
MRALHEFWGWSAVAIAGLVGLWGVGLAWRHRAPGRAFGTAVAAASAVTVGQVVLGVYLIAALDFETGDQHVFYGLVIAFVLAFAYIYRAQLREHLALRYGLLFLFIMGLGLRAIATLQLDF